MIHNVPHHIALTFYSAVSVEYGLKFATCIPGKEGEFVFLVTTFGSVTRCVTL